MPDQFTVVTRTLERLGVANRWHIVDPAPGGLRDNVWIQNIEQRLSGYVEVSPVDVQFLDEPELMKRVQAAMLKAGMLYQKENGIQK
jgi:hypothetical protein